MFFYTNAYAHKKDRQKTRKRLTFHRSILLEITFHCGMESHIMGSKSSTIRIKRAKLLRLWFWRIWQVCRLLVRGMRSHSNIDNFLGSTLFSFKFCSFKMVWTGWRILVDSEFSWTLFNGDNKGCQSRGCVGEPLTRISEQCSVSGLG